MTESHISTSEPWQTVANLGRLTLVKSVTRRLLRLCGVLGFGNEL